MQHNPRTVLRQVPNRLLARFLSRYPGFSDFKWGRIAAAAKVPLETILGLQQVWIANSDFNTAMAYLAAFGLLRQRVVSIVGENSRLTVAQAAAMARETQNV